MGCRNAASAQLLKQHPGASEVRFTAARVVARRRGEVRMRGEGSFARGARQLFSYDCTYRTHSAKTTILLSFPDTIAQPRP